MLPKQHSYTDILMVDRINSQAFNNQLVFASVFICMMSVGSKLAISGSHLINSKKLPQHYLVRKNTVTCFGFCIKSQLGRYKNCIESN
jgi:hypothetical protein